MKPSEFEKMSDMGGAHWWYDARRRLLAHELDKSSSAGRLKILDMATACGDNMPLCSGYGTAVGIDISPHSIKICRDRKINTVVQADAHVLPFEFGSFDVVLALDVFEHLEKDADSMREVARVLKKGGKLIFNIPAFMSLFSDHDRAYHHLRRYRSAEIREKLEHNGLKVSFITYWSFFIFPLVFVARKVLPGRNAEAPVSDFHLKVPAFADRVMRFLSLVELSLIKRNFNFPFGVSLFGIAHKAA